MDSYLNFRFIIRKRNLLAHISIWAIVALVLTISLTLFKGNLIGVVYLLFFLIFVLLFQTSYKCWARSIKLYCVILIMYSTSVSLLTYAFQYTAVNTLFKEILSAEVLYDIGLVVRNDIWLLFREPFVPLTLSILLVVYLRVFHDDFNRFAYLAEEDDVSLSTPLTSSQVGVQQTINDATVITLATSAPAFNNQEPASNHQRTSSDYQLKNSVSNVISKPSSIAASRTDLKRATKHAAIKNFINATAECCWRVLETHFVKIVVFMIFRLTVIDICLLNFPFLFIVLIALKYPSAAKCSCLTASWLISSLVIIRNLANLTTVKKYDLVSTCGQAAPPPLVETPQSLLTYIGLNVSEVDHYLLVLVLTTIFSFITIHYERRRTKDVELSFGVIFTGIGRREADMGIISGCKYFCNFGFYKFGVEITCLALVIAISNRLDSVAAIYGIILILISTTTSKQTLAKLWPVIIFLVSLLIPVQYVLRLGLPGILCEPYPWEAFSLDFKHWLFLSDYNTNPDANLLLFDFLVLLSICRQAVVFRLMTFKTNYSMFRNGQLEHDHSENVFRSRYLPNPDEYETEDCFSNYTTQSNYLKSIFFKSIFWITLAVVLVAGATKISLFSLGYLIGCFIFLWLGNDAYLMPLRRLIFSWNWFILYATLVIFCKVLLQLYTCYLHETLMHQCYVLQLLRVVCYRKINTETVPNNNCTGPLPNDELDILWDGLCLMFLLMQRVVFGSQYFRHLVQEVKAQQILASRGAELILATQIEEAKAQALYEKEVMRSIREKMENLKTDNELTSKVWQRLLSFPHHHQIIRNANKHLFSSSFDEPVTQGRTDDWKFRRAFIPDPIGDELERMDDINGIMAVMTRWLKGKPLYGQVNGSSTQSTQAPTSPFNELADNVNQEKEVYRSSTGDTLAVEHKKESDGGDEVSFDAVSEDDTAESEPGKIRDWWDTFNLIVYSILLSLTVKLNKLSRSYRYVSRRMAFEKNTLKKQFNLDDERFKRDQKWRKWVIGTLSETYTRTNDQYQGTQSNTSLHRIRSALRVIESNAGLGNAGSSQDSTNSSDSPTKSATQGTVSPKQKQSVREDPEYHFLKLNMFTQFCRALAYVFVSNTSLLCQIAIIFNQVLTASLLSLPLPLLTFLWGTLSVPRPTKRFWKTVITYTELVIVIKYVFQFPIWNWEISNINPFYYPNLLGIKEISILYDLILLLTLFFHRSMLKSLGQWNASAKQEFNVILDPNIRDGKDGTTLSVEKDNSGFNRDSSPDEGLKFAKSYQLQENLDRSIELAPRTYNSAELDRTMVHREPFPSYQNDSQARDIVDSEVLEDPAQETAGAKSGCCLWCTRAYKRIKRSIFLFFQHALNTPYKVQTDVYVWMVLCDFINFLILIYGFWAFGSGYTNQTVASFLNENRIPFSVLIMLLAQFGSIIVDRAFYLQKNIGGKLVFQLILIVGIHLWLFFALPFATGHTLTLREYLPPKAFYVIKCLYFLLSAHQIRCGYPRRVLGNCFTKGYSQINWAAFKVYRALPLVYDLRLYMDWIWTETTLEFRNWSIMEDMFANLFIRKCDLMLEEEYPQPRAKPISRFSKYITGGIFILFILAIIWGPLLLFSMGKTVGESNPPVDMEFELEFVGFQPILKLRATSQQITMIDDNQYDLLKAKFVSLSSQSFLGDYKRSDIVVVKLDGQSNAVWEISPPSKELLMNNIKNNETLLLKSSWTLYRIKREKSQNIDVSISGSTQYLITGNSSHAFRLELYDMLDNSSNTETPPDQIKHVITPPIFPNYLRVPETGQATPVDQFDSNSFDYQPLRPLNLTYIRMFNENVEQIENSTSWWKAVDLCKYSPANDSYPFWGPDVLPHCDSLILVAFNNRIFTGLLALLSAPGIIGLYTTFVVFFARLIRTEPAGKVIYTEIPKVDRVYGLIMDIYMMRECKEFELEEKLFAKLLFLYRSPELLIEWSRRDDELQLEPVEQNPEQD